MKSDNVGVCALCQCIAPLCKSHIIPDFCYKHTFTLEKQGRLFETSLDPRVKPRKRSTGYWQRLLCRKCEILFQEQENYVATELSDKKVNSYRSITLAPDSSSPGHQFISVPGDSGRILYFFVSVIWRMSVSDMDFFGRVKLLPEEEEDIRRYLLQGPSAALPSKMRLILCSLEGLVIDNGSLRMKDIVVQPQTDCADNAEVTQGAFFGYYFLFVVSMGKFDEFTETVSVKNGDRTLIKRMSVVEVPGVIKALLIALKQGKFSEFPHSGRKRVTIYPPYV
ncbi:hypothetical protein [Azospirillum soli]|uniref:hypothetical protein n=1 Tax=Azospirillum soli TaxID=1304799 RepID=UPI001AE4A739|nr:hypothetical protein [Azospirillum soli]MBP2316732.1 hypothetical protein [Azospirillum soli]